jgi:hypothetical protein
VIHPSNQTIVLAPLDERPVNTRYPQMLGEIAGAAVLLPPPAIRGLQRAPADVDAVGAWMRQVSAMPGRVDAVIASADYIAYGNLINARISGDSASDALTRLRVLEEVGRSRPVYAFGLITRVSRANDSVEEPLYWSEYGLRFYRLSQLLHRREANALSEEERAEMDTLEAELPKEHVADWIQRRLRNHTVNLALIDLLARDRFAFLLLTSDDTSPWGTPSHEKAWLESWVRLLGPEVGRRAMIHPGADEVGSALVARRIAERNGACPAVYVDYAVPGGEEIVAPYEDRAVHETVAGQIRACGCKMAEGPDGADIVLGVLTPSPRRTEFRDTFGAAEREERLPHYAALFERLGAFQRDGRAVALGDVAYPNGSDPLAMELLLDPAGPLAPSRLAAYGGWNTAGNTLGVVVAQAVCSLFVGSDAARRRAQARFLTHRFLEDWGYQHIVRRRARAFAEAQFGRRDPDPDDAAQVAAVCGEIEAGLRDALATLQARDIGAGHQIVSGSVRLPWRRTFEVDFELT